MNQRKISVFTLEYAYPNLKIGYAVILAECVLNVNASYKNGQFYAIELRS